MQIKKQYRNHVNKPQQMAMVVTFTASTASNSLESEQTSLTTNMGKYRSQSEHR